MSVETPASGSTFSADQTPIEAAWVRPIPGVHWLHLQWLSCATRVCARVIRPALRADDSEYAPTTDAKVERVLVNAESTFQDPDDSEPISDQSAPDDPHEPDESDNLDDDPSDDDDMGM